MNQQELRAALAAQTEAHNMWFSRAFDMETALDDERKLSDRLAAALAQMLEWAEYAFSEAEDALADYYASREHPEDEDINADLLEASEYFDNMEENK